MGKARGTLMKYPPAPLGADPAYVASATSARSRQRFGPQAPRLRRVIRRWRNPPELRTLAHEGFSHGLRIHPRAKPVVFCEGG